MLRRDQWFTFKRKLRINFLTGLIVALPILGSFWILSILFLKLTNFIYKYVAPIEPSSFWDIFLWRLVALVILFLIVIFIGWIARNYIGRKLVNIGETFLSKVPILNKIYSALKQIFESFWGEKKAVFRNVVLIEFPREGTYSLGFITSEAEGEIQEKVGEGSVSVFIPSTPNPTSGFFVMVPKEKLIKLNMSVEDAFKMILSSGMVPPKKQVISHKS